MRLSEMGPGRDDAPLPAEVEAELSALDAALAGDDTRAEETLAAYLAHQDAMLAFCEALAFETFGRDIPQILLAHVNRLNADAMPELLRRLRTRGYIFVTLDSVMDGSSSVRSTSDVR